MPTMTATPINPNTRIEYGPTQVRDLRVVLPEQEVFDEAENRSDCPPASAGSGRAAGRGDGRPRRQKVLAVEVDGERLEPTPRFWRSLFHRFGLNDNVFRYFGYDEVFARVVERNPDDRLRLCVERNPHGRGRLLAVSNPKRPVLTYDQTMELVSRHGGGDVAYRQGVLTSAHAPRSGERGFFIGPDQFNNRFMVEVPVDGYGQPRIFLSLLRQVCENGAVGYSRAFRSDVRIGEDVSYTLERALGQFDHDEGFASLRQRFEAAQKSWASLHETLQLQKTLARMGNFPFADGHTAPGLISELNRIAGDLHALYGLANLEGLSAKRQRVLPAKCRVYDLINFASEIATHRAPPEARPRLQGYIGTLISDEYDLEGTAEKVPEFNDLFLNLN